MSDTQLVHATQVPGSMVTAQPTFEQVLRMAENVAASGMFACKTKEQALTLMLLAQAENLHPIQAMRQFHIIQGRPSMRSDAMLARFQKSGGVIEWHDRNDKIAAASFSHPLSCPTPVRVEWSIETAKAAELLSNTMWKKYPRQMLTARVISEGVRTVLPEVCVGLYTPEEAEDMPPMPKAPALPKAAAPRLPNEIPAAPADPVVGMAIDAAGVEDPYAYDNNFIEAWRVTLMDRDFSEADADKVLGDMLMKRNISLGELTLETRHKLIGKARAGDYDKFRAAEPAAA